MNNCISFIKNLRHFKEILWNALHFQTSHIQHVHQNAFVSSKFRPRIRNWDKSPSRRWKYHKFWPPPRRISTRFITVRSSLVWNACQLHGWEHSFGVSNATVLGVDSNGILLIANRSIPMSTSAQRARKEINWRSITWERVPGRERRAEVTTVSLRNCGKGSGWVWNELTFALIKAKELQDETNVKFTWRKIFLVWFLWQNYGVLNVMNSFTF